MCCASAVGSGRRGAERYLAPRAAAADGDATRLANRAGARGRAQGARRQGPRQTAAVRQVRDDHS